MRYRRMPIEVESPEEVGYGTIDCNLAESSIWDARFDEWSDDLKELVLSYGEHRGAAACREAIAQSYGTRAEDVLTVPGAAAALFIVNSSLLERDTSLTVVRPNYATNIETPRLLACDIQYLDLKFETRFDLDIEKLISEIRPNTRLISVTYPHNPTGVVLSEANLKKLVDFVETRGWFLLVDETYRDLHRGPIPPLTATLSSQVISVGSVSKAFGLPGIRMGWIICSNPDLQHLFLAAKEQIFICNSVIDEEIARRALSRRSELLPEIRKRVDENYETVKAWMQVENHLEWVEPEGGVVCLPRIRADIPVDVGKFYSILQKEYRTCVGPGRWFEMSDRYFRLGYGWEPNQKLATGLKNISSALELACSN
jgi:aspartate/methionine/tyrosine aminotransferase